MSYRFAVLGNPIKQSQSPIIHQQFALQFGHDIDYQRQLLEPETFVAFVERFFAEGGTGLNVTAPFKLQAFDVADQVSERAQLAQAVNTLSCVEGKIVGDNTDGYGLVTDITRHLGWQLQGKRVLVLGAGGAVRGVLKPILDAEPTVVHIANRTASKADALANIFKSHGSVTASGFEQVSAQFDVVINGTSSGLSAQLPAIDEKCVENAGCYDMVYSAEQTLFNQWAEVNGAVATADGLGMLVGQAAESYAIWMNQTPDVSPVLSLLRENLTKS